MKLRNKKTDEIIESACIGVFKHKSSGDCERVDTEARSLEKVLEVWEDYIPKEPRIKDKKIRDIIRTWAEVNGATGATELRYYDDENCLVDIFRNEIHFNQLLGLEDDKTYTVTELCGEEVE